MDKIKVNTKSKKYDVIISESFLELKSIIEEKYNFNKILFLTDDIVEKYYLSDLMDILSDKEIFSYVIKNGETSKNLDVIKNIYEFALNNNLDKTTLVISLGGGVVGDIAGFFSSTYYRGLKYIQIPTTLLSQVDSSVGGKTGVDLIGFKNIIGTIYQPEMVFINLATLKTLNNEQFSCGMAEIIKYSVGFDNSLFKYINKNINNIKKLEMTNIRYIVKRSLEIKAKIVEEDELENGKRALLNLGHTFGHSIEKISEFKYTHGEAIAIGTMMSLNLSKKLNYINDKEIKKIKDMYLTFDLPVTLNGYKDYDIYKNMISDKKKRDNKLNICVIDELGSCIIKNTFTKNEIIEAIKVQNGDY